MQLERLSAAELGRLVNNKIISASEVVDYFCDRIEKRNPYINAFTYTKFEEARGAARTLDLKLAVKSFDKYLPFAGVPFALKDFLSSKAGWTNSHGGVASLIRTDEYDSEFCKAAEQLGGVAVGKTNAPAFGFSGACQNKLYGATCNPFDVTRTSGGSSGGSAAAVADGLVLIAEGGDAGGSIRIPAGWCNLFGFKPSLGTVPSYCRPDGWSATHPYCFNGGLTKTVEDSAILLNCMARYNPRDPISLPINTGKDFTHLMNMSIKGWRIGLTYDFDLYPTDPAVRQVIYDAALALAEAGAHVEFIKFNFKHTLDEIMHCWAWSISVDTALDLEQWKSEGLDLVKDHREELPEEFVKFNKIAAITGIQDMRKFNEIRTDILDNLEDVFESFDLIISPTATCLPMLNTDGGKVKSIGGTEVNPDYSFLSFGETPLMNFVGYPAASVPAGLVELPSGIKLPVGMQIVGKQYHDEIVFAAAKTFETIRPWRSNYDLAYNRNL